jgi:acyl-coenzyme A thioesterase PaaI-like protein
MHFTPSTLQAFLVSCLPSADMRGIKVNSVSNGSAELSLEVAADQLSVDFPRGSEQIVVSGPSMLGLGDTAMYAAVHSALGPNVFAVVLSMNTSFFRLAKPTTLVASARVLRQARSVCFADALLFSMGEEEPCAHVTATYATKRLAGDRNDF